MPSRCRGVKRLLPSMLVTGRTSWAQSSSYDQLTPEAEIPQDTLYLNCGLSVMIILPHPPSRWSLRKALGLIWNHAFVQIMHPRVTRMPVTGLCFPVVILPWVEHSHSCGGYAFGRSNYRWRALPILAQNVHIWVIIRDQLPFYCVCGWSSWQWN